MSEFSVLLPVYAGDDPAFFARAVESVTADQKNFSGLKGNPVPRSSERSCCQIEIPLVSCSSIHARGPTIVPVSSPGT